WGRLLGLNRDRRGPSTTPSRAARRGRSSGRCRISPGVLALAERHVGDLAQLVAVVAQGADMAPVDLVGIGFEVVVAERLEAFQHAVDLQLGGDEGVECLRVVGGASGHLCGSSWRVAAWS